MHEAKSLSGDLEGEKIDSGYVAAGLREVRNETECDRIVTHTEYNRDRCGCSFGRERSGGAAGGGDHGHATPDQTIEQIG
jgi:hypothetical protein